MMYVWYMSTIQMVAVHTFEMFKTTYQFHTVIIKNNIKYITLNKRKLSLFTP